MQDTAGRGQLGQRLRGQPRKAPAGARGDGRALPGSGAAIPPRPGRLSFRPVRESRRETGDALPSLLSAGGPAGATLGDTKDPSRDALTPFSPEVAAWK